MTKKEVITFLERIRKHYPKQFIFDERTIDDWNKTLQFYSDDDVNNKLDQHLRNEDFKDKPPSLNFLVMYLKPTTSATNDFAYECSKCHKIFNSKKEYENHYERCMRITTIIRDMNKYFNTSLVREQFEKYSDDQILQIYYKYVRKMLELETGIQSNRRRILLNCLPEDLKSIAIIEEGEKEENGRETTGLESNSQSNTITEDIQPTRSNRQIH